MWRSAELFAGAGGMTLGLRRAGFDPIALIDEDADAVATLSLNLPEHAIVKARFETLDLERWRGVDLLAIDMPSTWYSEAGLRDASNEMRPVVRLLNAVSAIRPRAIYLQNVRSLASHRMTATRIALLDGLADVGYSGTWRVLQAADYGVPQLRPRFTLVAFGAGEFRTFDWPLPTGELTTLGASLAEPMAVDGWRGADLWADSARALAPTLIGGSRHHGGPDLGPTRAKQAWLRLGIDPRGVADTPPTADDALDLWPRLTNVMLSKLQAFPDSWRFAGRKTSVFRQIAMATPPPVAFNVGQSIGRALET